MRRILLALVVVFVGHAQAQTISAARAAAIGTSVTVSGIVINGSELGPIRYIQDATGAIAAYSASQLTNVLRGDSVTIVGTTKQYNNLLELDPVTTVTKHTSGNAMPTPTVYPSVNIFAEAYEGQLVKIATGTFTATGSFAGNTNYNVTVGTTTIQVRTNNASSIVGTPIPSSPVGILGIMSQFSVSNPSTGYQFLIRDVNDLLFGGGPIFTTDVIQSNIQTTSFNVSFKTQKNGNTIVYYGLTPAMGQVVTNAALDTNHQVALTSLTPGTIYYVRGASIDANGDTSWSSQKLMATASLSSGKITAYFNQPVDTTVAWANNQAVYLNRAVDDTLLNYINRAKYTMDIAIYNWNNSNLADLVSAVNAAYNRGVKVRVIAEGGNANVSMNSLASGIGSIKRNSTQGIMHDKFVVFDVDSADLATVWTGSTNWTEQQIHLDCNNVIIFQDQSMARAYTLEFEEMWGGNGLQPNAANSKFGPNKSDNTPHLFNVGGKLVEVYFSPSDDVENKIKEKIRTADSDIEVAMMQMTRTALSTEMIYRFNAGAFVGEVVDDTSTSASAPFLALKNASPIMAPRILKWSGNGIMHNKYMVVDQNKPNLDPFVLTGSHNWSSAANTTNDENTVVVHDANITNQYFQNWLYIYKLSGGTQYITAVKNIPLQQLLVYPNPSNGSVYVQLPATWNQAELNVIDLHGKLIRSEKITSSTQLENLPVGVYIIQLNNNKEVARQKLIVH